MKPSLSLGLSLQKSSMEVISSGVQSCSERFTLQEREWCNGFGEEEESKRRMWESFTDQELIHGGQLNWYLDKLKKYQPPQKNTEEETEEVRAKTQTVKKLYAKSTTFKQVFLRFFIECFSELRLLLVSFPESLQLILWNRVVFMGSVN